jgi:drug/metabolite transporter (DMT)-like permease
MLPFLIILAISQVLFFEKEFKLKNIFRKQNVKSMIIAAFIGDFMSLFGVYSGQYTIISHTLVLGNLGGAILICVSLLRRENVHRLELIGTSIAVFGCVITVIDPKAQKADSKSQNIPLGDLLAICASFFTALYFQQS